MEEEGTESSAGIGIEIEVVVEENVIYLMNEFGLGHVIEE